jgi:hypothetical protein
MPIACMHNDQVSVVVYESETAFSNIITVRRTSILIQFVAKEQPERIAGAECKFHMDTEAVVAWIGGVKVEDRPASCAMAGVGNPKLAIRAKVAIDIMRFMRMINDPTTGKFLQELFDERQGGRPECWLGIPDGPSLSHSRCIGPENTLQFSSSPSDEG